MPNLSIQLFGPPRIEVDGRPLAINRRKAIALGAYLAATGQPHHRDALATLFWPESNQKQARASLRVALWSLNKTALRDWLVMETEHIELRPEGTGEASLTFDLDVAHFRQALAAAGRHAHPAGDVCPDCLELLTGAAALFQNDFMAGFTLADAPGFDEWQFFEGDALRQELAAVLEKLIQFHRSQGAFDAALPHAHRLLALDPLNEDAHRQLIALYALSGQKSAALRQFQSCVEILQAELGLPPADETAALAEAIRAGGFQEENRPDGAALAGQTGRRTAEPAHPLPHNLPAQTTAFIGRDREVARLAQFLEDPNNRLLTIVGPGGIGKTRLALAVAAGQVARPETWDGVYFVSLTPFDDAGALVPAIADAAGFSLQNDPRSTLEQLSDYLKSKAVLLVLDNFEHLLAGAAVVVDLLQTCPRLKILATSRERLNLYEEQRYPLGGLDFPAEPDAGALTGYPAVALFLHRARQGQPDLAPDPADLACVARICRLVEGMPLALELAASWITTLSLPEILAEIEASLDFLESDVRNLPARHQSIRAVFDASWHRLTATEQAIYAAFAVFRGGFTSEAARLVTGTSIRLLSGLVNKSLLRFNPAQKRYELHELLRQYAAEKLGERTGEIRQRHAATYAAFLARQLPELKGAGQIDALARVEQERENAGAAWRTAVESRQLGWLEQALDTLGYTNLWHGRFGDGEALCRLAIEQLEPLLAAPGAVEPAGSEKQAQALFLARALTWQAVFLKQLTHLDDAREALDRAQDHLAAPLLQGTPTELAKARILLERSELAKNVDFGGEALALNQRSLALYRAAGDDWGLTQALEALSIKQLNLGRHDVAEALARETLEIHSRLKDPRGIARTYSLLGLIGLHNNEIAASVRYLRQSQQLFRQLNNRADLTTPLFILSMALLFGGRFDECLATSEECLAIYRDLGMPPNTNLPVTLSRALINLGRYEEAGRSIAADLDTFRQMNFPWGIAFSLHSQGRVELAVGEPAAAGRLFEESVDLLRQMNERTLRPEVLFCLAIARLASGERSRAEQALVDGLSIVVDSAPLGPMRFDLAAAALLLAAAGETEQAVEFYAAAEQSGYVAHSAWFADIAGRPLARAAADLPAAVIGAARRRGRARDLWQMVSDLLAELTGSG